MSIALRARWAAMHGAPRAVLTLQGMLGDPMAQLITNHRRGRDPYPLMEQIRARGPLVKTPFTWVSVDHGVCREVLRDKRFSVTPPAEYELPKPLRMLIERTDPGVANPVEPPAMVIVNPPEHTRYRQLVAKSFTPRAVDALGERVAEVTGQLIDELSTRRQPDLIADFACRLPVAIIAEMLDLPDELHPQLLEWGHSGAPLLDVGIAWSTYRAAIDGLRGVDDELRQRFHRLRAGASTGGPFSRLAADGDVTVREFTANAALLIGAGFETTVNLIGNGIAALLQNPDQLALLREDPALWPGAVEEILRFDSPVQMTGRTADCDVEIAGQHVTAGEMITVLLGGANRDPYVFAEPGRFDVTRSNSRDHLAFATGIHVCLGAALARIEGVTALRTLFEAFPDLQLATAPQPRGLVNLRGFASLPAKLGARRTSAEPLPA